MSEKEIIDEDLKFTLKKIEVPFKRQKAIVKMTINNSKIIQGQEAIMMVKLNKILLASVSHEF